MHAATQSPNPSSNVPGVACGDLVRQLSDGWNHLSAVLVGMPVLDTRWKPAVDWLNQNRCYQKPIPRLPNAKGVAPLLASADVETEVEP